MDFRQVEQSLSSFFLPNFCETLKNHQLCQKFGKKLRKPNFNLPFLKTHFSDE